MLRPVLLIATLIAIAVSPAAAQRGEVYCNVTAIESEQLSNGVRVTIVADGELHWGVDWEKLIEEGAALGESSDWGISIWGWTERFRRLPLRLWNARSKLGSAFVPIDKYPVSHAKISIPEWADEGVGLEVEIVNYLGWWTGEFHLRRHRGDWDLEESEDSNSIIVLWESDRFPEPPSPKTPSDLPAELAVTADEGLLSLRAVNAKLQDVASAIAREAGFPVIAPPDDDVRVSLHLDDIPPVQALKAIATGYGLCAHPALEGGWIVARPAGTASGYSASESRRIHLRHLRAVDALDLLPSFLLRYLHADEQTNTVVATAPEYLAERVADDLSKLDTPPPEVSLDVVAVEYTSGEDISRALQLERSVGDFATALDSLTGGLNFLWLDGLPEGWSLLLDSLEVQTSTRLRSRASVRVLNGRHAKIFAGQERYIIIESLDGPRRASLERIETGTIVDAQPLLGDGDEVVLFLYVFIGTMRGTDARTGLPILAVRDTYGSIRVRDGETILIAGLRTEEEERQDRAIPILGDIPVVGGLFRAPERSESQTHLAIFITPRILRARLAQQGDANHG